MRSWSLRIGTFFGIEVLVHWTFWILIIWVFLMHFQAGHGWWQGVWGALFVLALFACVVLHEFGHALTARQFGVSTKDITLYPIGGIASLEGMPEKPAQELAVGLAGPAVNFAIALVLWLYLETTGQTFELRGILNSHDMTQVPFLWNLLFANVVLAVFNLIPAFPMDGGRVFRALISFFTDRIRATRIAAGLGQLLAILFVFLGFFYNFWLVFIGLFIFLGAGGEATLELTRKALVGLKVGDALMRRFTLLNPDDSLGDAARALLNSQETEFVVADRGRPVGLLGKHDIIRGLSERGKDALVAEFMTRSFVVLDPETTLEDFFGRVLEKDQPAIVMDGEELLGLIDRENLEERLQIQQAMQAGDL